MEKVSAPEIASASRCKAKSGKTSFIPLMIYNAYLPSFELYQTSAHSSINVVFHYAIRHRKAQ